MSKTITPERMKEIAQNGGTVSQRSRTPAPKAEPKESLAPTIEAVSQRLEEVTGALGDLQRDHEAMMIKMIQTMSVLSANKGGKIVTKVHRKKVSWTDVEVIDYVETERVGE